MQRDREYLLDILEAANLESAMYAAHILRANASQDGHDNSSFEF